jgi:hypothetical protein
MTKTEKNCAQEEHHFEEGHDFRGRAQLQSERRNFRGEGATSEGKGATSEGKGTTLVVPEWVKRSGFSR